MYIGRRWITGMKGLCRFVARFADGITEPYHRLHGYNDYLSFDIRIV